MKRGKVSRFFTRLDWRGWCLIVLIPALFTVNWIWQAVVKPSEVIGLLEAGYFKDPRKTWEVFGPLFREHSTSMIPPELLAALSHAESRGNPIARTYWRWRWTLNPFAIYAPASSAVGLLQITDGTFAVARQYCIHGNKVAREGDWYDSRNCWFNSLYSRVVPSHAIEMTSAYLHVTVSKIAGRRPLLPATWHDLAALTHLCGPGVAEEYLLSGMRFAKSSYCEAHNPRVYLKQIRNLMAVFKKM